jgi:hypothetical protein
LPFLASESKPSPACFFDMTGIFFDPLEIIQYQLT